MPTLRELRTYFSRYQGQGNDFTTRLNLVLSTLLPEANGKGTKVRAQFAVYQDSMGNNIVTLPRELEAILAGAYQSPDPSVTGPQWCWCGQPIPIRNSWYSFSPAGPGNIQGSDWQRGIELLEGRYTTFADWNTPKLLRIKLEQIELAGNIIIRGELAGQKIYSADGANWIEGVSINFTNATVTTTQKFDQPPYEIVKTKTKGRVRLYTVDDDLTETLVGYYDPAETTPSYTRYKVPACPTTT